MLFLKGLAICRTLLFFEGSGYLSVSGPDPVELPGFWGSMVFRHAPIPWKGSDN